MGEVKIISSEEDIKIFADINRFAIIDCLATYKKLTTNEISNQTGLSYSKVSYSLKKLEEVGIVKIVDTKLKCGIQEKYYALAAKEFIIERPNKVEANGCVNLKNLKLLDETILKSLSKEYIKNTYETQENNKSNITLGNVYLTDEEFDIVKDKIDKYFTQLLVPYKERRNDEEKPYTIANVFFRRA